MPNIIENSKNKPFTKKDNFLNVRREDILYRDDIKISFFYALFGITVTLAIAGGVYVIGKKLIA